MRYKVCSIIFDAPAASYWKFSFPTQLWFSVRLTAFWWHAFWHKASSKLAKKEETIVHCSNFIIEMDSHIVLRRESMPRGPEIVSRCVKAVWTDFTDSWISAIGGRQGHPPETTFARPPPKKKDLCPLKLKKKLERTIETIAYCFKKQWHIVFAPHKFCSSRKPEQWFCPVSLVKWKRV